MAQAPPRGYWPWLPFVVLSLAAALLPGFALGAVLAWDAWRGAAPGAAWAALVQAHAHAQLVGWGGAMVLGVALTFLPRLAGAPAPAASRAAACFGLLAAGLALRLAGQAAAAAAPAAGVPRAVLAAGALLEGIAVVGTVASLLRSVASGAALAAKRAFHRLRPLFGGAFAALALAEAVWAAAALRVLLAGPAPDPRLDRLAQELTLLGFIVPISLAMSARLFPLFFRTRPASPRLLDLSALLLLAGVLGAAGGGLLPGDLGPRVQAAGELLAGLGIATGTVAVQVFAPRVPFPGDRGGYRTVRDPAALGALSAYAWAALGALALVLAGLEGLGWRALPGAVARDLPIHVLGAGFMTLLILAVAPVMLPGFAGRRLRSPSLVAWSVGLANLAAVLRTAPGWARALGIDADPWALPSMAAAGLSGLCAVALLAVNLALSIGGGRPRAA